MSLRAFGLSWIFDMRDMVEDREEELLERWRQTKLMPRKMKKKVRKDIQLDFSINEYAKTLPY